MPDIIASVDGPAAIATFLERHEKDVESAGEGLKEFLTECRPKAHDFDVVWHPAFAQAQRAKAGEDARCCAVRLALRLSEAGRRGAWSAHTTGVRGMTLAGHILPHEGMEIRAETHNADEICVSGRGYSATFKRGQWRVEGLEPLRALLSEGPSRLLHAGALPGGAEQCGFGNIPIFETIDDQIVAECRSAIEILEMVGGWLPWIARVLRGMVVCHVERGFRAVSGSSDHAPGLIHVAITGNPMDIAESLVHECAHQYFYMIERIGPIDDGSDTRLYYSPPIRRERPLNRILMAYHALANIGAFYDGVEAAGVDDGGYVARNRKSLVDALRQLDAPLRGNAALTIFGRSIYEPLADRYPFH